MSYIYGLCTMLTNIPKYIGGAKTLYISKSDTIFETLFRNEIEIAIEYISVCQYDNNKGFYLFGCDKDFNTHTDFFYDNLDEALEDAERLYQIENIKWTQIN
jgi:hypothetical protein